jgi:hypothetical protein
MSASYSMVSFKYPFLYARWQVYAGDHHATCHKVRQQYRQKWFRHTTPIDHCAVRL